MPLIDVSNELFADLQELATPLVDTTETVIRRLINAHRKGAGQAPAVGPNRTSATTPSGRARKGDVTPKAVFRSVLLQVLRAAGGELPAREAINQVGLLLQNRLNDVDRGRLKGGQIRWENRVAFVREDLVKAGVMEGTSGSGFGTWRLVDVVTH